MIRYQVQYKTIQQIFGKEKLTMLDIVRFGLSIEKLIDKGIIKVIS